MSVTELNKNKIELIRSCGKKKELVRYNMVSSSESPTLVRSCDATPLTIVLAERTDGADFASSTICLFCALQAVFLVEIKGA